MICTRWAGCAVCLANKKLLSCELLALPAACVAVYCTLLNVHQNPISPKNHTKKAVGAGSPGAVTVNSCTVAGVLNKLSLAGLVQLSRLRYS
jgi:hypothetical protein